MLVALVTSGWQAFAQTSAGLKGVVTDSSGAVVPAAEIVVTNLDNGAKRQTVTNETGDYDIPLLRSGRYTIAGRKPGFKQAIREDVRLELNQIAQIDFTLTAGAVSETVEVESTAPLLESNTSSVGQVIETKAVSDLPLNGRNFAQLAILGPGVTGVGYSASGTIGSGTRPDDMRPGTELFSNGNREQSNNFMLDGVDNNFRRNGLITLRPSVEAVPRIQDPDEPVPGRTGTQPGRDDQCDHQVRIESVSRQRVRISSATASSTRRISSRSRGSPKAQYQQNQFGASLGGPHPADKLFFFADYEGFRKRQGTFASVNTVPTVAMRDGDFSGVRAIYDPFSVHAGPRNGERLYPRPIPRQRHPRRAIRFRDQQADPGVSAAGHIRLGQQPGDQSRARPELGPRRYPRGLQSGAKHHDVRPLLAAEHADSAAFHVRAANDSRAGRAGGSRQLDHLRRQQQSGGASRGDRGNPHFQLRRFIVDARFGYGRFNLHALKDGAQPGANLGEKLGVKNSNQGPFSYGLPIFSPSSYTGIGGPASHADDPAREHIQSEHQFHQVARRAHHQVRHEHRASADHRFSDQSGRRALQLRSDLHHRPEQHGQRPAIRWRVSSWARLPGSARISCWCGPESGQWRSALTCRTTGR